MIDDVKWVYGQEIQPSEVTYVEDVLSVKFPIAFVDIILKHDESRPKLLNSNSEWVSGVIDTFVIGPMSFGFISFRNNGICDDDIPMLFTYRALRVRMTNSEGIIPFAESGGGDYLLFDYRANPHEPSVVFLDHEDPNHILHPISSNFSAFLDLIYPYDGV